jgi:NTE family protein
MLSDLERMARINDTLKLISVQNRRANEGLQHIESFVINPSHDFNAIAAKYYHDLPLSIRVLLRGAGIGNDSESSIVSYLLFEKNFCSELIRLGFADAMEQEQAIRSFLEI